MLKLVLNILNIVNRPNFQIHGGGVYRQRKNSMSSKTMQNSHCGCLSHYGLTIDPIGQVSLCLFVNAQRQSSVAQPSGYKVCRRARLNTRILSPTIQPQPHNLELSHSSLVPAHSTTPSNT